MLFFLFRQRDPFQVCIDKNVNTTVQNCVNITGFFIGSMVFYHGVWLQDIGTDLVSPADICHFASNAGKLLLGFLLFQQIQLGLSICIALSLFMC